MIDKILKKIPEKIKNSKYIIAALIFGVMLMLMPTARRTVSETKETGFPEFSLKEQEEKLEKVLTSIDGAGKVKVMLTLHSGSEQILASDSEEKSGETTHETVIVSSGSGKQEAVTVKYTYPTYLGAAVVAEGADSANVRLAITKTVSAVTGLDTAAISVIKMKKN